MKSIEHYWYGTSKLVWLLLPLSWLYCLVSAIRRKLYQLKFIKSFSASVPVVVVGNIVAGGSGKTPLLISLCQFAMDKGFKPAVVSRGYGGSVNGIRQVKADDSASLVGDEPLMIFQRLAIPVVVAADRVSAVNHLLAGNECDIIFSDDGLQHYRMQRSLEIAVVDSVRRFGNGYCLPAGPLREPVSRLNDVDMVVYNGTAQTTAQITGKGSDVTQACSYTLQITAVKHLDTDESQPLSSFADKVIHAVAGIGNPVRFFDQLRQSGLTVIEHAFPDHHSYQQADFSGWDKACIIMTEKDAVKCRDITIPDAWAVIVNAEFSELLESKVASCILPLLNKKQPS